MKTRKFRIINGNQAVAHIAYKTNEVCAIYPITPSSEMSELVEEWSAYGNQNILGSTPSVFEMQSEAGVAGAMHGALQAGSLATTFTASQGLLLMFPNMFKIAGELTPNVIHVATRSIATHALSVYGDHSDVMAVRSSGYAMLGAASVQEAHDFALISQVATLESRIPFVHFFDGFRTSHELAKIEINTDEVMKRMMDSQMISEHRKRALNPNRPVIRGTTQNSDTFFQSREATNEFYNKCPDVVQKTMNKFAELTNRQYHLFDYVGHPDAENVIITMASSSETVEETVNFLNTKGEKYGLIKVRLFRPFSTRHLLNALPKTVKSIAVLDRTKEPGATGEPLYLDVVQALSEAFQNEEIKALPRIVGGRYGLSSKEFTPNMVQSVFDNLKQIHPKSNFTIGINDDITHLSLPYQNNIELNSEIYQALIYRETMHSATNDSNGLSKIFENTDFYTQRYHEFDYKKSASRQVTHLRIASESIKAPYLISNADLIVCQNHDFVEKDKVVNNIKPNGTLLINTSLKTVALWESFSAETQRKIMAKNLNVYMVNQNDLKPWYDLDGCHFTGLDACFFVLSNKLSRSNDLEELERKMIRVDATKVTNHHKVPIDDKDFATTLLGKLLYNKEQEILVSDMPIDGTFQTNSSLFNPSRSSDAIPKWSPESCTQCGACSMACPQAAIRIKVFDDKQAVPEGFELATSNEFEKMHYSIQVNLDQCNGCNNCVDVCEVKALKMTNRDVKSNENWNHFDSIPEIDRTKLDLSKVSQQQLQEPLFKYSTGDDGCGEAPYLKLLSQLFGDRLLVANATGSSSIFGGALPTTPWSKTDSRRGPAWSSSLFEDNAEFGLGLRLSLDQQTQRAIKLLKGMIDVLDFDLVHDIISANQNSEFEIVEQRNRVALLKQSLIKLNSKESLLLFEIVDSLVKKSVWCVGGDGWAYDIGYGGLDHVIASGKNVNILILDNEVYSNTGGQMSKATPFGAATKFAAHGKIKQKKDLGLMAMTYNDVYVASVSICADQEQTLKAFVEAEGYDGPSIIIAYSHNISHGIDIKSPSQYHKSAVKSGQWLLYRNDPRQLEKGLNSLQLDSSKPSIKIEEYLMMEKRFANILGAKSHSGKHKINLMQRSIDSRFNKYTALSNMTDPAKVLSK